MLHHFPSRRSTAIAADTELAERDRGSVLLMILALMVLGSLAVVALLTFATTLFINRPPIEVRDRTFWSAKSAMSMAMVEQTAFGPESCYKTTDVFPLNGYNANVTCTPVTQLTDAKGRLGVITTSNVSTTNPLNGLGPTAIVKPITGGVFVNGGNLEATSRDLEVTGVLNLSSYTSPSTAANRYQKNLPTPTAAACTDVAVTAQAQAAFYSPALPAASPYSTGCVAYAWWQMAGDEPTVGAPRVYPTLPPLPLYTRPSAAQASIPAPGPTACNVYFPGQYDAALTLAPGKHYFASGVYYFTNTVTLQAGAVVVAGEGRYAGCAVDAEAAFAPSAPKAHSITGKGATFLFGGAGRLISTNASLQINRRVSDASTRGSESVAIRSVNFGPAPPASPQPVQIPNDAVVIADVYDAANPKCNASLSTTQCMQTAASHTAQATPSAPIRNYTKSALLVTDNIVQVTQTSGSAASNQFVADGYVFVPNAKVSLSGGTNANYRMKITGGVVASSLNAGYSKLPSVAGDWFLGVQSKAIQLEVSLLATVTAPNGNRTLARANLQVHQNGSYAIKGWTVDPNVGAATTVPPTTAPPVTTAPPGPTTTTTLPPTTTTTTTTLPPTTTTTVPPSGPCNTTSSSWTRNFGTGTWAAQYWNWSSFSSPPSSLTNGTVINATLPEVYKVNDASGPGFGVNADYYTARFTKTVNVTTACKISLQRGSDDGIRVKVNGTTVIDDWAAYAYKTSSVSNIQLNAGANTIIVEYYEQGGESGYSLEWKS